MKFGLSLGKNGCYALCDTIFNKFLDILEFTVENKQKKCLEKTILKIWSQIGKKNGLCVHKTPFRKKVQELRKIKTKNRDNFHNLLQTAGTKLVLLVDF